MALSFCKNQILRKLKVNRNCKKNKHKQKIARKFSEEDIQLMIEYNTTLLEKGIPIQNIPIYE